MDCSFLYISFLHLFSPFNIFSSVSLVCMCVCVCMHACIMRYTCLPEFNTRVTHGCVSTIQVLLFVAISHIEHKPC